MHNMYLHVVADLVAMCVWMNAVEDFFFTFFIFWLLLVLLLSLLQYNCPALDLSPLRIIAYLHTCLFFPPNRGSCPVLPDLST